MYSDNATTGLYKNGVIVDLSFNSLMITFAHMQVLCNKLVVDAIYSWNYLLYGNTNMHKRPFNSCRYRCNKGKHDRKCLVNLMYTKPSKMSKI